MNKGQEQEQEGKQQVIDRLNEHAKQQGSDKTVIYMSHVSLPETTTTCAKCSAPPTHLAHFTGKEKRLCGVCALKFRIKNGGLPADLWFCRPL
jgi:hypothetical protein